LEAGVTARDQDLRSATVLSLLSVGWNTIVGVAAVASAVLTHSAALTAFGLNAVVDSIASIVLIWRFRIEAGDASRADEVERTAVRIVGIVVLVVAAFVAVQAARSLATGSGPRRSVVGIGLAAASVGALAPLALAKRRLAARMASPALAADAVLSGVGAVLAATALAGEALSATLDIWWADAVAAIVMVVVLAREGWAALRTR
jgi:divalent metal cation (Fe/Co/Zn/Cd) transporter